MADLQHIAGTDLSVSTTGDISVATGVEAGRQRVLRRLVTNLGDYIFSLNYGAGLAGRIGGTDDTTSLEALVQQQLGLEPAVSAIPTPLITISPNNNGTVEISITYTSTETGETIILTV